MKIRQFLNLHREGHYPVVATLGVMLLGALFVSRTSSAVKQLGLGILAVSISMLIFLLRFFRAPALIPVHEEATIVSPASGTILGIEQTYEADFATAKIVKIAIFLSVFNVHLNVVPVSGTVTWKSYYTGQYLIAFHPKASQLNERCTVEIVTASGQRIGVRQIAGLVARRIKTYLSEGDTVEQNDELGFIKFGSRVELLLPLPSRIIVKVGDNVRVGTTVLALLEMEGESRNPQGTK